MSYYAIGIGGTGAKCIESLVHLCAAGLMPDEKELFVMFVDPDKSNGTLDRAQTTLQHYSQCRQIKTGGIDLLKTPIRVAKPDVWSPFGEETDPTLENFFQYAALKQRDPKAAHLFDVLYSNAEKETKLGEGFRGHPSIGAAILADSIDWAKGEPWKSLGDKIASEVKNNEPVKVILMGSIFGGTGAAGVPTIAKLIRQKVAPGAATGNFNMAAVTMLPYFSFERNDDAQMRAQAEDFLINSQAALKYYARSAYLDTFETIYVLGDQSLSPLGPPLSSGKDTKGGLNQRNEPHFLEMYAALAAVDFYCSSGAPSPGVRMVARDNAGKQTWQDMPFLAGRNAMLAKIDQLIRFAFAYYSAYFPALESMKGVRTYQAPWFINFFERQEKIELSEELETLSGMRNYCQDFLYWSAQVQTTSTQTASELFNCHAFAKSTTDENGKATYKVLAPRAFQANKFAHLLLPQEDGRKNSLSKLWARLCDSSKDVAEADGAGKFINALYRECISERWGK